MFLLSAALVVSLVSSRNNLATLSFNFSLLILASFLALQMAYRQSLALPRFRIMLAMGLYLLWLLISLSVNNIPSLSYYGFMNQAALPLAFFATLFALREGCNFQVWFNVIVTVIVALSLYCIIQFLHFKQAPHGFFENKNLVAGAINLVLWPVVARFLSKHNRWLSGLLGLVIFILAYTQFTVASRAAQIIGLLVFLLLVFMARKQIVWRRLLGLVVIFVLAYSLAAVEGIASAGFSSSASLASTSHVRLQIWQQTLPLILQAPFMGNGLGTFAWLYPSVRLANEAGSSGLFAHNDYLQLWCSIGLIGLLIFLYMLWRFVLLQTKITKLRMTSTRLEAIGLFCGLLAVLLHSGVTFNLYVSATLIIMGVFAARLLCIAGELIPLRQTALQWQRYIRPWIFNSITMVLLLLTLLSSALISSNYLIYRHAQKLYQQGHVTAALSEAYTATRVWPYEQTPWQFLVKQSVVNLNYTKHAKGNLSDILYQQGMVQVNMLQRMNPYNSMAYLYHGKLAEFKPAQKLALRQQQAIALYQQALVVNPWNVYARMSLAQVLEQQGNMEQATKVMLAGSQLSYHEVAGFKQYEKALDELAAKLQRLKDKK
jgi:O-antigen ligase